MENEEYYKSEEFWKTAPSDAEGYIPDSEDWFATFWKHDGESWWCLFEKPEHWQSNTWAKREDGTHFGVNLESLHEYIKRPDFTKKDNQPWTPIVGETCILEADHLSLKVEGELVVITNELIIMVINGKEWVYPKEGSTLKPLPKEKTIQEKMLDKWVKQGLDFAYDTPESQYTLSSVFDFVVKNFNVEEI